jgi:hypothetical protein
LLTRAALLVSGSEYTRPILKGREVRFRVMCDELPPPPANLVIKPLQQDTAKTTRQIVEEATASATCQACHSKMNPLGFASENFDSLGRMRTLEQKLDVQGAVVNTVGIDTATTGVRDAEDLGTQLAASGRGQRCMVQQYFRFTFGRHEDDVADGCDLEGMRTRGTLVDTFKEIARRDSFRIRRLAP